MIEQMNNEFIKACAEFKPEAPIKTIWKVYYDKKSGKVLDVTPLTRYMEHYIVVEEAMAHAVSVIPNEYRVKEETLIRASMADTNTLQLDKLQTGKFKTLKDDMIFIDMNGEDSYD